MKEQDRIYLWEIIVYVMNDGQLNDRKLESLIM